MLSDELLQLLTAYVDGELSPRQYKAVRRLLDGSPEARALLGQLDEDAQKVRQLPRRHVQPSLVPDVLQTITEQGLHITRPAVLPIPAARWRPYAAAALAASILLGALGGIMYFASDGQEPGPRGNSGPMAAAVETPRPAPERETPAPRKVPNPLIRDLVGGVYASFTAPLPPEREPVFSVAFRELLKDLVSDKLSERLDKDRAVQLDVTVKNNPLALERLQGVLEENGIKVVIDPQAKQTLKKNPAKVEYLVYAENLRTDELTRILRELGRDDDKLQKFQKSPFEKITLTPLTATEKKHVSGLLGVEAGKMELTEAKGAATAPKFNRWERSAVVLPTGTPARTSTAVQGFVGQRRPQPGTLQVLVRIHTEK